MAPVASRARRAVRIGASAAARVARDQRHTMVGVAAAAAAGFLQRSGTQLPHIRALGVAGTYGLGALILAQATRTPMAQHVATGLLAAAAYDWARGSGSTSVSGVDEVSGEL
jgi:hypothetical protein